MKRALIVYSVTRAEDKAWKAQLDYFADAAHKAGVALEAADNGDPFVFGRKPRYSFVLMAMPDLFSADMFESHGYSVFNGTGTMLWANDKALLYSRLAADGVGVPLFFSAPYLDGALESSCSTYLTNLLAAGKLAFPLVGMKRYGLLSDAATVLAAPDEFKAYIAANGKDGALVTRQLSPNSFLAYMIGERCVVVYERKPGSTRPNIYFDQSPYLRNRKKRNEIVKLAKKAMKVLECDFAEVAIALDKEDRPVVISVDPFFSPLGVEELSKKKFSKMMFKYMKRNRMLRIRW